MSQTHCLQIGYTELSKWKEIEKTALSVLPRAGHKTYLLLTISWKRSQHLFEASNSLCPEERKALISESQGTEECVHLGLAESPNSLLWVATCCEATLTYNSSLLKTHHKGAQRVFFRMALKRPLMWGKCTQSKYKPLSSLYTFWKLIWGY